MKRSTASTKKTAVKSAAKKTPAKKSGAKKSNDNSKEVAQGLRDLFVDELKDIYWAEKALTKAIPKMIKKATSEELISCLEDHLKVTQNQVARLEEVFESIGEKAQAKKCEAMAGLTKEAEEIMSSTEDGMVRDAGIISAAQKIEHYEIASYGTLCAFAKTLGEDDAAELLQETLNEEKEADETLTGIAESEINIAASKDEEENEEEEDDSEEENDDEVPTLTKKKRK